GGLTLPAGFCATIFADSLGHVRHLVVAANGDVYANTWSGKYYDDGTTPPSPFVVALRDANHDGRAEMIKRFGDSLANGGAGGTGIALYKGGLFVESKDRIVRYTMDSAFTPSGAPTTIVGGLPLSGDHPMHPFVIDSAGQLFMDVGSKTNSCQAKNRTLKSPGLSPCTELETRAGIWSYDANKTGQTYSPAGRYATGIRNAVGIAIDPTGHLFATQHGRDQLGDNWAGLYTPQQGADLPAEELLKIEKGGDYGWPTCYFDSTQKKLVLAPEYGGDGGKKIGDCDKKIEPAKFFPAHWAPDALVFYNGTQFPPQYKGGAFIAFHGSWNRAPRPQEGYRVVFVSFASGSHQGEFETFANDFAGTPTPQPTTAKYRPSGLAVAPDGSLYVSDDAHGRIWHITYKSSAK
ncbi:MAG: PQQ-dependent sugar dehydrogenase, partial [Gemmatimonadota bacterium]|nr:PQQ-dependent sugar dehydrogenase [Gemmatimonadota bacterium]